MQKNEMQRKGTTQGIEKKQRRFFANGAEKSEELPLIFIRTAGRKRRRERKKKRVQKVVPS